MPHRHHAPRPKPERRTPPAASASASSGAPAGDAHAEATPIALVDASNVAHATEGERGRLENILLVRDKLVEEGFEPILVADAALRHRIDDGDSYERLVSDGTIKQAPAGTDADYFILAFARELGAKAIVSNDRFRDREASFPEARERVVRYMIVEGEVVLERRTRRRKGKQ
jgi:hypothetical protein